MPTHLQKGVGYKRRAIFQLTEDQLSELTKRFKFDPYIKGKERKLLAKSLGITPSAVTIWFSLQRMKLIRNLSN